MQSSLEALTRELQTTIGAFDQASYVDGVSLEPGVGEHGDEFLRILVRLRSDSSPTDAELEALLEAIEDALQPLDERHASVRFLDAA